MPVFDDRLVAIDAVYNVGLAAVDFLALFVAWRTRDVPRAWFAVGCVGLAAVVLAVLSAGMFLVMRLLAFALFIHLPLALASCGVWMDRRAWWTRRLFGLAAAVLLVVAVDAFWIEPRWLQETRITLESEKIARPLRVVLLADLQTDHLTDYERRVFQRTMALGPDIIVLAGDYLQLDDPKRWDTTCDELRAILADVALDADDGVYAVAGNVDSPKWPEIFAARDVQVCQESQRFARDDFVITCLSMKDSFDSALSVSPDARFHLVLGHSPDFALGNVEADLLLAGHVHGGQVRLPFVGPLVTLARIPRTWTTGCTELPGGRHLIVSRGIGMERGPAPRLRFLCRPEIVVIDIQPARS